MQRKGQAAMEFLMTYGWAILAAIVAIGVLAYFGVFSPGRYLSNMCVISAPFGCEEYSVGGDMELVIRNGYGSVVDISSITIDGCLDGAGVNLVMGPYNDVVDGSIVNDAAIVFDCNPDKTGKFSGDITITFRKDDGLVDQTATGTLSGRAS